MAVRNWEDFSKEIKVQFSKFKYSYLIYIALFSLLVFVDILFLVPSVMFLTAIVLLPFARAVEKSAMIKNIYGKDAVEGDWLVDNVIVGKKTIEPDWEGLTKEDLKVLKKFKGKIKVKDGIPFVPAFLFALIMYYFRFEILEFFFGIGF